MIHQEAEILIQNGFPSKLGNGCILVGKVLEGQVEKEAVLIIDDREVNMKNIQTNYDSIMEATRIEFEVGSNLIPPVLWWKLYDTITTVRNKI